MSIANDQSRMTARAQLYIAVVASRHFALAAVMAIAPGMLTGLLYAHITIALWLAAFLAVGSAALVASVMRSERLAYIALFGSIFVTGCWIGGMLLAAANGQPHLGALVAWVALGGKDAILLRNPLRDPFEPLIQRLRQR